jgi:hypothetical protein
MKKEHQQLFLYVFSILVAIITYGFALTNFSLSVDSEMPAWDPASLNLGRWGNYFLRSYVFNGLLPYYTLLFGLIFLGITSVEITKILNIKGIYAYIFCLLFVSFPQHAYQLFFTMQADAVPLGFFLGTMSISLFLKQSKIKWVKILFNVFSVLFLASTFAMNQALILVPFVLYILYFFIQINNSETDIKKEFKKALSFAGCFVIAILVYLLSVKIFVKSENSAYFLNSYASGKTSNPFIDFFKILVDNIFGNHYYGEKPYILVFLGFFISLILFVKEKRNAWLKSLIFVVLLIIPFTMSFFIRSGWHPPRLYVSSPLVFVFVVVFVLQKLPKQYYNQLLFASLLLFLWNSYYVTNLFYTQNKIFKHDLEIAKDISYKINSLDGFNSESDFVYFYGGLPMSNHEKLILPKSEVFESSIFRWDNGNNWRIFNFFKFNDILYYRFLDDEKAFNKIKDSLKTMPVYPLNGSVKKIENVVVVKLNNERGSTMFEWEK